MVVHDVVDDFVAEPVLLRGQPGGDAVNDDPLSVIVLEGQRVSKISHG